MAALTGNPKSQHYRQAMFRNSSAIQPSRTKFEQQKKLCQKRGLG